MTDQQQVAETELRTPPDDLSADPPQDEVKPHPVQPPAPEASEGAGAGAGAEPVPTVAPASPEPGRWGRADPDGTVFLCTAEGERVVGSWQAGDPADGLAHYARRFDDLLTEVDLLDARLSAGGGDPKHTLSSARQLRTGLDEAAVVGDVIALGVRLDALIERAGQAVAEARASREAQRGAAVARKEVLAAEAEQLAAESTHWKQAGERFKEILEEWRTVRGVDRKTDEALWRRFSRARDGFNRRRGAHFAELDRQRAGARSRKEELVTQAEQLSDSSDWGATAAKYRELMAEWKAAGRAHKDTDDALWQRFRAAQDAFFGRRSATFAERDAEFTANASAKEALLKEAEQIDLADPDAARARMRTIQQRWEATGKVPRQRVREFEARMRAAEQRVKDVADSQWRRADPEAQARVDQFRARVEQYEAQAAKAHAAGDARRAEEAAGQAKQWREWLATAEQAVNPR